MFQSSFLCDCTKYSLTTYFCLSNPDTYIPQLAIVNAKVICLLVLVLNIVQYCCNNKLVSNKSTINLANSSGYAQILLLVYYLLFLE